MTSGDDRSLVNQALDVFVYAPLGLLLEARDLIPKMADRGRGQVALVKLAGKVAQNRQRAAQADLPDPRAATADAGPTPPLPIDGYDDLSAPQLLPKLVSLDPDDLETILTHEQSHRARATVLNKIRQLQG